MYIVYVHVGLVQECTLHSQVPDYQKSSIYGQICFVLSGLTSAAQRTMRPNLMARKNKFAKTRSRKGIQSLHGVPDYSIVVHAHIELHHMQSSHMLSPVQSKNRLPLL